jgi:hypothetical protein
MGREFSRKRGMEFEQCIARLFTQAGYSVYKYRGPFDIIATKDDALLAVQVKTTQGPGRPRIDTRRCVAHPLPDGAQRLYWHHCGKYDEHQVYSIDAQGSLNPVPNPLEFMFPPALDKKMVRESIKLHKTRARANHWLR